MYLPKVYLRSLSLKTSIMALQNFHTLLQPLILPPALCLSTSLSCKVRIRRSSETSPRESQNQTNSLYFPHSRAFSSSASSTSTKTTATTMFECLPHCVKHCNFQKPTFLDRVSAMINLLDVIWSSCTFPLWITYLFLVYRPDQVKYTHTFNKKKDVSRKKSGCRGTENFHEPKKEKVHISHRKIIIPYYVLLHNIIHKKLGR